MVAFLTPATEEKKERQHLRLEVRQTKQEVPKNSMNYQLKRLPDKGRGEQEAQCSLRTEVEEGDAQKLSRGVE